MTDEQRLPDPCAAAARLPRGSAVILRHYGEDVAARAALAQRLRRITRARGVRLLVAASDERDGLALAVGADGIHLPQWRVQAGARALRRHRRRGWLVTAAAHSWTAVRAAMARRVSAVVISPVFTTASHPDVRPLGALHFRRWALAARLPVYALGGVDCRTAAALRGSGACGLAAIGGLAAKRNG